MSGVLDRVPDVSDAVLTALGSRPAGLPVNQLAAVIGEEQYVTEMACRQLRAAGRVSWVRQSGSREWRVRLSIAAPPTTTNFAAFAREMGFARSEIAQVFG